MTSVIPNIIRTSMPIVPYYTITDSPYFCYERIEFGVMIHIGILVFTSDFLVEDIVYKLKR